MTDSKLGHFYVEQLADGRFAAASATSPYFCFRGDSEKAVLDRVRSALATYGEFRGLGEPRVVPAAPAQSLTTFRAPKKVPFSEVCAPQYATA